MAWIINCWCFHTRCEFWPKLPKSLPDPEKDDIPSIPTQHGAVVLIFKLILNTEDGGASSSAWDSLPISAQHDCCTNTPIDELSFFLYTQPPTTSACRISTHMIFVWNKKKTMLVDSLPAKVPLLKGQQISNESYMQVWPTAAQEGTATLYMEPLQKRLL